jgi:two-component system, cell cycle response regulator
MRITRKVFLDLAIVMISFGLFIGAAFPFFMLLLGIPREHLFTPAFFLSCAAAGVAVGLFNIMFARSVVGRRISQLSEKMRFIGEKLQDASTLTDLRECTAETCELPEDSDDELGDGARSFNLLVESLTQSIASESALRSFNVMLASRIELEDLTKGALEFLLDYSRAEAGAVIIERGGDFEVSCSVGISDAQTLLGSSALLHIIEKQTTQRRVFPGAVSIDSMLVSFQPAEMIACPILYKEVSLGLLLLAGGSRFPNRMVQSLEMFIQSLSLALKNAVTYDQLQKLAANDPLTGLYNRRFGLVRLAEEYTRSVRSRMPVGLLMFDIDHFKRVNDTYGHTIGDRVLVNLSKVASMAARKGDLLIRYGGEEFVVILPGAAKTDCQFVAERMRHMVEESLVQYGDTAVRVTISIGAVSFPEHNVENEQELIQAADKALYLAKGKGRNMVVTV